LITEKWSRGCDWLVQVVSHKDYKSRDEFDAVLHQKLFDADIDIVCLAGFMRILTGCCRSLWSR